MPGGLMLREEERPTPLNLPMVWVLIAFLPVLLAMEGASLWMVAFSASAPYQTSYEPLPYRVFKYGALSKG